MPEISVSIGGREFSVSCQDGEEHFLLAAAKMLDTEAQVLVEQIGRLPEHRMLLMAGLMLADRTAGLEDQKRELQDKLAVQEQLISDLRSLPQPEAELVEVAVIPTIVTDTLSEIAARAEALAAQAEEKAAG